MLLDSLGRKAGETAVAYLDTLGKDDSVCLFISRPTSGKASSDRFDGFKEIVLESYPNAKIIEEGDTGAGTRDSAQTLMENVLQRESVIDIWKILVDVVGGEAMIMPIIMKILDQVMTHFPISR